MAFTSNASASAMADINVTPLVDVMLVLLIIFMVTMPIQSVPVDVDLPQRSLNPPPQVNDPPEPIRLRIDSAGQVFWNDTPTPVSALQAMMKTEVERDPTNQPTLEIDTPLVFDVVDLGNRLSLGGATYHVVHPGGRSYDHPPVNAKEAEARRSRRFEARGHTTGVIDVDALSERDAWRVGDADEYPLTLDLRRRTPRRWGRG